MKIGLEVHVQLLTKSKLFCGCAQSSSEPNTLVCDYCLGLPGTKPRLNARAVEMALRIGCALGGAFPKEMFFSRKAYFYPDMAKNFQITQYEVPVATRGSVVVQKKKIRIRRINIEEDPARLIHAGTITHADYVLVDYNRSGVPLCEIVTEPDFRSPREARLFLQQLSSMLQYLGIFDPESEGSMRVDANISLVKTRVEVKNVSGFKDVERALQYEIVRQSSLVRRGKAVARETRGWDAAAGVTRSLRAKEEEEDYGYIFEGDLPRITLEKERLAEIRRSLPEFAQQKIQRYRKAGVPQELAESITSEPDLAAYFEHAIKTVNVQLAARWFAGEIKKTLNYDTITISKSGINPEHVAKLLRMIEERTVTERTAELMFREMVKRPRDPTQMLARKDVTRIVDAAVLGPLVREALDENAKAIVDYKSGRKEALNFLVGVVMKKTQGRGDSDVIRKLLLKLL